MSINKLTGLKALLMAALVSILLGCTTPLPALQEKTEGQVAADGCAVRVIQDGKAIPELRIGGLPGYTLRGAPFRIEVASDLCNPSLGLLRNEGDLKFISSRSVVVTPLGFALAGAAKDNDILAMRSEDPRVDIEDKFMFEEIDKKYKAFCERLGECPLVIRAFRNYWSFMSDEAGTPRRFSEFNRLTRETSLLNVRRDIFLVVYTNLGPQKAANSQAEGFEFLAPHAFVLRFR